MAIETAGVLLYRRAHSDLPEVLLVHLGGPLWTNRDLQAWSIPKGAVNRNEEPLTAAKREFSEEVGSPAPQAATFLGNYRQNSRKNLSVWIAEGDLDPLTIKSNTFKCVWPPKSGRLKTFPEVDKGEWFEKTVALKKIVAGQRQVLTDFYTRFK